MRRAIFFKQALAYGLSVVVIACQPLMALAESAQPVIPEVTQSQPADPVAPQQPSPEAPVQPKKTYIYNPDTKRWDSDQWKYSRETGNYEAVPKPAPAVEAPVVAPTAAPTTQQADGTKILEQSAAKAQLDAVNKTTVENALDSIAKSGAADVTKNLVAGNAATGSATATATIINNLNSSISNSDNAKAATFVTDVMGDVHGDIMIKPMLLKAMLEAEAQTSGSEAMKLQSTSQLTNNINLSATSGNASVIKNTQAGDATTGAANTVANVVNIVNSMIAANRSFVGTVNIYGNLDGDILIAPDFLPQLLASNAAQSPLSTSRQTSLKVDANDTQTIVNNVNLNAASGTAAVTNNTSAGSATTGTADTNTVIFNMTGHDIVAKNSLLVFVNVLGKWVGMIVDAPAGATSAAIGNGVTQNSLLSPDIKITADNNTQITNNLNLNSQSGNALVSGNTLAGNARSGNATASANIANITNSQFGLSDWFGVLYINVFGNWFGSFGIDTAAGSPIRSDSATPADQPMQFIPHTQRVLPASKIIPTVFGASYRSSDVVGASFAQSDDQDGLVLGQSASATSQPNLSEQSLPEPFNPGIPVSLPISIAIMIIGYLLTRASLPFGPWRRGDTIA